MTFVLGLPGVVEGHAIARDWMRSPEQKWRKPKAKAPLPPAETKCPDVCPADESVEPPAAIMEQNENMVDKDIELSVVLPGDIVKSTTVHGSKPMMDLLVFLCAQYRLNPSSHTIDLLSAEQNHIRFKPNTPIGMLEVEKVILKPKTLDKKKPTPIIPEKTVRVVINFKKTQKAIVRVSPHVPLEDLVPVICSKCEFDPLHTVLLKDYQAQEPLDLTKSLNDLGLRELYAMDVSRESCQVSQSLEIMKEKENKGFFSFFQRSKKKREQTVSAPATPLVNKHRPSFTRSNTISKPYVSNTLPSDAPKKRRAPLPPMHMTQGEAQAQERCASLAVRSTSMDDADKSSSDGDIVRTGSLQLSSTSVGNSSLKRTKRKAPAPPSKTYLHQSDENGHAAANALQSVDGVTPDGGSEAASPESLSTPEGSLGPGPFIQEQCTVPKAADETSLSEGPGTPEAAVASLTSGISSDYSLEEIDEKEELSSVSKDQAENVSVKSPDIPSVSTDVINTLENDPDSALGLSDGEASPGSKGNPQESRNTDGQELHSPAYDTNNEEIAANCVRDSKTLDPKQESVQNEIVVSTMNTEDYVQSRVRRTETNVDGEAPTKDVEVGSLSGFPVHRTDNVKNFKENHLAASSVPDQKLRQPSAERTNMQDASIQATPSCNSFDGNHQDHNLSDLKVDGSVQTSNSSKSTQHSSLSLQEAADATRELRSQGTSTHAQDRLATRAPVSAYGNDDLLSPPDGVDKNPTASHLKNFPLYRQDYNPKPKPSNEITREYIPKIGMTTYKIVPPKSLEMVRDWESETVGYKDDQKTHVGQKNTLENMKEPAMQTEALATSEGPKEQQPDLKPKPSLGTERQLHRTVSSPDGAAVNPLKPPRTARDTGVIPFAPNLEDINNILESKFRSRVSNPQAKPSSFFLQMQKRASGHYVTSAAAKSVHTAPTPTHKELTNKEVERDPLPPPEQIPSPLCERTHSVPLPHITKTDGDTASQKPAETSPPPVAPKPVSLPAETSPPPIAPKPVSLPAETSPPPVAPKPVSLPAETSPPPVAPKPVSLPAETSPPPVAPKPMSLPTETSPPPVALKSGSQAAAPNLKTLKTFGAPRPYSSSAPSPFALAVVKRSQSFSKAHPPSSSEGSFAQSPTDTENEKACVVHKPEDVPQQDEDDKQNKSARNEQKSQIPTPADCPSFTLKRQSSLTLQSSDPEQIRQSLLTAIRSGEAAAKLKRVTVPSNTISMNGKSGLSHAACSDAQDSR
ncbi:cordon-bleu protein-like 1 isoform X2 [Nannospalax galili]|uniref:cordon-bleu protein-like 1 isoform X2 n=1 Tax=Nannospalax galili TaxID=1026970 RepID=UPI00111C6A55|nr:cordon-bleu protein-like 1 isoform X2 [Nannospalax galili]